MRRIEGEIASLFLLFSLIISACTDVSPTSAVVLPQILASETAMGNTEDLMPTPESVPIEGNPVVRDIQTDCRYYMAEPQADMCMGLVELDERYVWTGVLSSDYQPGTIVIVHGYFADNSSTALFSVTTGTEREFVFETDVPLNPEIVTFFVEIGSVSKAVLTSKVTAEMNKGQALWLLTAPVELRPTPDGGDGFNT